MMVPRDVEENDGEAQSEEQLVENEVVEDGPINNGGSVFGNAAEEVPEYRNQLLLAKENMANIAEMFRQDYLDKVEERADLANEARIKAVSCLVDVSSKIYNLAGCFEQLLQDQADKLQDIENLTVTASASLEITSCYNLRNELHVRIPPANVPNRQPRIGRPENMQTDMFTENVMWEKLDYNKYDRLGAGIEFGYDDIQPDPNTPANLPKSTSQHSIHSTGSSNRSFATATSAISPVPSSSNNGSLQADARLSTSNADVRQQPTSPALDRYGSSTSLTSLNSSKSDNRSAAPSNLKSVVMAVQAQRTISSLKLQPSRAAPAPPPAKQSAGRQRVYSVKNETGEGLEKPSHPAPRPPEEEIYAIPPTKRMPTLNEERSKEVIYDDVRKQASPGPPPPPLTPQYQTIAVAPPDYDDDDLYMDMDEGPDNKRDTIRQDSDSEFGGSAPEGDNMIYQDVDDIYDAPSVSLVVPAQYLATPLGLQVNDEDELYADNDPLPFPNSDEMPPPPDDIPPPPPPPDDDDDLLYADIAMPLPDEEDLYTDNVIDNNCNSEMVNVHTVSVSKDSGFYTEEHEDEDQVIEKVRAIYTYVATASDELNLKPGDIVSVHVKNPDGWFEGSLDGIRGLFPGNYAESLQ